MTVKPVFRRQRRWTWGRPFIWPIQEHYVPYALNTEIDIREQIRCLTDPPVKAGLGLAIPFLICCWLGLVRLGDREQAQQAVNEATFFSVRVDLGFRNFQKSIVSGVLNGAA